MNRFIHTVVAVGVTGLLTACAVDSVDSIDTVGYSPGYTGYTVGMGDVGISNGYGPSYWNTGYYPDSVVGYGYNYGYSHGYNHGYTGYGHHRR
jgi:hypothetical protein